jgi:hypothetical protein
LNGAAATSSAYVPNGVLGLDGQMVLTAGGTPVPWTFEYRYEATTFTPITTGFHAGLNTIEIIANDTSGGLNFRDGLLSGGYYWYTGACYDHVVGCNFSEERNGIIYYRGDVDPPTSALFTATVTYDLVSSTPLPAALPLFATGLSAFGLLTYRKRRKQA